MHKTKEITKKNKQHIQWQPLLSSSPWKCYAHSNTSTWLRSSSSQIIITNHIQSKPSALRNTWTMTLWSQHPASNHSGVSGKACSDPGALQSQSFIKGYSCILLFLSVALLIATWVIWQASLHNTIVWITEPTWETWGECHLAFHSGEIEIQNKPIRDFGSSTLDGDL